MAAMLIIATFACMIAAAGLILVACYAALADLWAHAVLAALAAILAISGVLHFGGKVEAAYVETIANAKGNR